jgi:hypothetical protein
MALGGSTHANQQAVFQLLMSRSLAERAPTTVASAARGVAGRQMTTVHHSQASAIAATFPLAGGKSSQGNERTVAKASAVNGSSHNALFYTASLTWNLVGHTLFVGLPSYPIDELCIADTCLVPTNTVVVVVPWERDEVPVVKVRSGESWIFAIEWPVYVG